MIKLNIGYDYGISDIEWINDFEKKYNISFPKSYCDLMLKHNGVRFEQDTFRYFKNNQYWVESNISFLAFGNPIGTELINDSQYYSEKNLIAFGLNEFGYLICFDYRQDRMTNDPPVVIMYHDEFMTNEHSQEKMVILPIANSFDEFLDMLYEEVD